jgi:hypothetical protein
VSRHRYVDLEPLTIDASVVVEFLERHERFRMAGLVRDLAKAGKTYQIDLDLQRQQYQRLYERLCKYEPEQPRYEPPTGVPPPESSD